MASILPPPLPPDPLQPWEREIIGKSVRLHMPLRDVVDLRRISAILRELGNRFEVISNTKEEAFPALSRARLAVKAAQARCNSKPKK
jgi:hypothetical protein